MLVFTVLVSFGATTVDCTAATDAAIWLPRFILIQMRAQTIALL